MCRLLNPEIVSQFFPDMVLSQWPTGCLAYAAALKELLRPKFRPGAMAASRKRDLLMHVHRVMSRELGAQHLSAAPVIGIPRRLPTEGEEFSDVENNR